MFALNWKILLTRWGPVVGLMALIFYASAQPHYGAPPHTPTVYMSGSMPILVDYSLNTVIKKSAHVIVYGVLAGLLLRALVAHGVPPREATSLAIVLALGYAITDELHQSTVFGRHSSALDIGFDYIGAAAASLGIRRYLIASPSAGPTPPNDYGVR